MDHPTLIAIRLRNDHVVLREATYDKLPITIGRGAENDLVLFDTSVSLQHAKIEYNAAGELILIDLDSRNGIRAGHQRLPAVKIAGITRLFIGLTEIEIEVLSREVTVVVEHHHWREFNRRRSLPDHLRIYAMTMLGWTVSILSNPDLWSPLRDNIALTFTLRLLAAALLVPVAALILLMILRTLGRKLRIADTLLYLCRIVWLVALLWGMSLLLYYPLSQMAYGLFRVVATGVIFTLAITLLATLRRLPRSALFRRLWAVSTALFFCLLYGISQVSNAVHGQIDTDYFVLPPWRQHVGRSISMDAYFNLVKQAAKAATAEAKKSHLQSKSDPQ